MELSADDLAFLGRNHSAAMITQGADGMAKATRVGIALVDGKVWSSGTEDRVRTRRLRRDPRCTFFVFDSSFSWLTLEGEVRIIDGPQVPELSVRLFREMQGRPTGRLSWFGQELDDDALRQAMIDENRLIYELDIQRAYGTH